MIRLLILLGGMSVALVFAFEAHDDAYNFPYIPMDHSAIDYLSRTPDDPVARLQKRFDRGEVKLDYEPNHDGYLPGLLKALQVNQDSQMLVFSRTSFQAYRISTKAPRALYFNDSVAVGFVQGGDMMEFAALDPKQGVNFYTMDVRKSAAPSFVRRNDECIACHLIPGTLNIPGLVVSSVITTPEGLLRFPGAGLIIDSRSPIENRWGGWYVTGITGDVPHRGNAVAPDPDHPDMLDLRDTQNLIDLSTRFDTTRYLAPTSDIVALMTLEHQTRMTNLITRIGWEARIAQRDGKLQEAQSRLDFVADELVSYMLFAGEAKIREPISGVSTFTKTFPERGPRDKQGRSLRDFDLHKRLFRFPLSYMIYSEAFDSLPDIAKQKIYRRLYDVLSGRNQNLRFGTLGAEDRQAILEILRDTKPGLPTYWIAGAQPPAVPQCCN
jgi:hypothetical protein